MKITRKGFYIIGGIGMVLLPLSPFIVVFFNLPLLGYILMGVGVVSTLIGWLGVLKVDILEKK